MATVLGIRRVRFRPLLPLGRAADWSEPPTSEALGAHLDPLELIEGGFQPVASCGLGQNLYVEPSGDSFPCYAYHQPHAYLGNVIELGLNQVLQSTGFRDLSAHNVDTNPKCHICEVRYLCGGACRAWGGEVTQGNLDRCPPDCEGLQRRGRRLLAAALQYLEINQLSEVFHVQTVKDLVVHYALKDKDYDIRSAAEEALDKLVDARAVQPLIKALGNRNSNVCEAAVHLLGKLGDARAVKPLINALGARERYVRNAAAKALVKIGDARAVEPLINALGDGDSVVRQVAAEGLGKLGEGRAVEPLITALGGEKEDILHEFPLALSLGLIKAMDEEKDVRRAAAEALGNLGDSRAVEPLIKALGDKDDGVRWAAANALGKLGDSRAVEPVIRALGNTDRAVRRAAAEALNSLGEPKWKTLVKGDDEDWARLGASGDTRAVPVLIYCLSHHSLNARLSAAHGLIQMSTRNADLLKADWQQVARLLKEPHSESSHSESTGKSSDCTHVDYRVDRGIGLDFPEQPPTSFRGKVKATEPAAQQTFKMSCPAPGCGKRLKVSRRLAGHSCRCPACGTTIQVPAQTDAGLVFKPDF